MKHYEIKVQDKDGNVLYYHKQEQDKPISIPIGSIIAMSLRNKRAKKRLENE